MKKRIVKVITLVLILILLSIIFVKFVNFQCIYKKYFGFYCTGCGFTRMMRSIFRFEFYQAFRYNPLLFFLLILFIPYAIYKTIYYIKYGEINIPIKLVAVITILLLIYILLRNISYFKFLIPTKI